MSYIEGHCKDADAAVEGVKNTYESCVMYRTRAILDLIQREGVMRYDYCVTRQVKPWVNKYDVLVWIEGKTSKTIVFRIVFGRESKPVREGEFGVMGMDSLPKFNNLSLAMAFILGVGDEK